MSNQERHFRKQPMSEENREIMYMVIFGLVMGWLLAVIDKAGIGLHGLH